MADINLNDKLNKTWLHPTGQPVKKFRKGSSAKKTEETEKENNSLMWALNQVASSDYPDLYDGIDIDFDKLGCIMLDTFKVPVKQYVENSEDDIFYGESDDTHYGVPGESEPHVTLLFGLLENGNTWKDKVDALLKDWELPTVVIKEVSYFDIGKAYAIVGLVEESEDILDGHDRLTLLPHINTFSEYTPHITLAYINKDVDPEKWVKPLNKRYKGQKVKTTAVNYGDKPEESDTEKSQADNQKKNSSVSHVEGSRTHDCSEHANAINNGLETVKNALQPDLKDKVQITEATLLTEARRIEGEMAVAYVAAVQNGDFDENKDILTKKQENTFVRDLTLALTAYYLIIYPIYAKQLMATRASEFGQQGVFAMTKELEKHIKEQAKRSAESHVKTVKKDMQTSIQRAVFFHTEAALVDLVKKEVDLNNPKILKSLPANPSIADIEKAVKEGAFADSAIYKAARDAARDGNGLDAVARAIKKEYEHVADVRAKTIARHESNRVFNMAQYQADLQFLTESGLLDKAYKSLRSRTGEPCPICEELINETTKNPIPFTQNFADLGEELTATYTKDNGQKAVQKLPINYEPITAGNVHVNCQCEYVLSIQQDDGTFLNHIMVN